MGHSRLITSSSAMAALICSRNPSSIDHHVVLDTHASPPLLRSPQATSARRRKAMVSVCHRERVGLAMTFGVPGTLIGAGEVSMCKSASVETSIFGAGPIALHSAFAATAITVPFGIALDVNTVKPDAPRKNNF